VPPPVLVPVFILFIRPGDGLQIFIITFGCVWPILLNTIQGVRAVDEVLRDTASCYRLSPVRRLFQLTLRAASPQIFTGARQALSVAIILMVISELFVSKNGLGYTIVEFQATFQVVSMWTGILVLGVLGVVLSLLFRLVESRALAWYTGLRRSERGE
jgi:ABC-type nitrate/sulfonate/bicarbonate transport system permease component